MRLQPPFSVPRRLPFLNLQLQRLLGHARLAGSITHQPNTGSEDKSAGRAAQQNCQCLPVVWHIRCTRHKTKPVVEGLSVGRDGGATAAPSQATVVVNKPSWDGKVAQPP